MLFFTFLDKKTESKYCRMYALHERIMIRLAMNILKEQKHAEDVVQDCFLSMLENEKLMQKLDKPDSPATKSYLMMMVKSRAINLYNNIKKQQNAVINDGGNLLSNVQDKDADVEKILARAELFAEAEQYLNILDPMDIKLMTLKYYMGLQNIEIAEILEIEPNLVGVRLFRAKKKLASEVQRRNNRKEEAGNG